MTTQPAKIIRLPEVKQKVGLGKSVIYDKIKKGEFPKQIKLGTRASGWLESEVNDWIYSQINHRDHEKEAA
jgi:prophage regulatory protein